MLNKYYFPKSCLLWHSVEKCVRSRHITDDNIIRRVRIACWIPKAIDTRSEYVILIASPLLQSWHERAPTLRYTYVTYLVFVC